MIRGVVQVKDSMLDFSEALADVRPVDGGLVWIDVQGQTRADLELLGERFGFHPLALEDCEHLDQRPKIEGYGSYIFLVLHGFDTPRQTSAGCRVEYHELHIFFNPAYLVTVHQDPLPSLERLWCQARENPAVFARGLDFVLHRLVDDLVDANFPILDDLSDQIEAVEDAVIHQTDPACLHKILELKAALVTMRRVLSPQREVLNQLMRGDNACLSEHALLYFRDIYDHLVRLDSIIDNDRDLIANARDAHFSVLSQRTNEIMKRLTLVSIVFLPLTFLTGFFGMNFAHLPFDNDWLLVTMLVSMVVLPLSMLIWFHRKKWFD